MSVRKRKRPKAGYTAKNESAWDREIRLTVNRFDHLCAHQQELMRHAARIEFVYIKVCDSDLGLRFGQPQKEDVALKVLTLATDPGRAQELIRDPDLRRMIGLL